MARYIKNFVNDDDECCDDCQDGPCESCGCPRLCYCAAAEESLQIPAVVEILGYTYVYQGPNEYNCYYYQCGCTSDCWTTRLWYDDGNETWSVAPDFSSSDVYTKEDVYEENCGPLGTYTGPSSFPDCTLVCECCDPCTEIFYCSIDGTEPPNCV